MNSKSLEEYGFKEWHQLNKLVALDIPRSPGIYVFKLKNGTVKRKVGESDILYIGETNNLRRRILGDYLGGIGGATAQRIHWLLLLTELFDNEDKEIIEVGWISTQDIVGTCKIKITTIRSEGYVGTKAKRIPIYRENLEAAREQPEKIIDDSATQERKYLEGKLIYGYKQEHGENPPWSYETTLEEKMKRLHESSNLN